MHLGKFFFILGVFICYGLLFSAQRMETREKDNEIKTLTREIELLNARKQELTVLIRDERERLVRQSQKLGVPLSPKDIIIIQ